MSEDYPLSGGDLVATSAAVWVGSWVLLGLFAETISTDSLPIVFGLAIPSVPVAALLLWVNRQLYAVQTARRHG